MAAPPPYWKRKTRPCPFYSQGRCLFADSCNFIHSAKLTNEIAPQPHELASGSALSQGAEPFDYVERSPRNAHASYAVFTNSQSQLQKSSRPPSQSVERKRRSVRSPPRSPRLSGLLFALQSVIGPDEDEDEADDNGEDGVSGGDFHSSTEPEDPSAATLPSYYSSSFTEPKYVALQERSETQERRATPTNLPELGIQEASELDIESSQDIPLASPFDSTFNLTSEGPGFSMLSDFPEPPISLPALDSEPLTSTPRRSPSNRARIPSPIVTQHSPMNEIHVFEDNTLEIRTHLDDPLTPSRARPQSTLDLLSSPFASPAKRALSLQLAAREPHSPIFDILSGSAAAVRSPRAYGDDDLESLETLESPTGSQSSHSEQISENRFSTDTARTPKTGRPIGRDCEVEIEEIPPLPEASVRSIRGSNGTLKDDEVDFTITAISQVDALSYANTSENTFDSESSWGNLNGVLGEEGYDEVSCEDEDDAEDGSRSPISPTVRFASHQYLRNATSLEIDVAEQSSGPSPISAGLNSSYTSETLVESPMPSAEITKSSRRSFNPSPFISPIKALRDSSCPPSLVNTIRPEPSPLGEEYPPRCTSSLSTSSYSSQRTTWDEVSAASTQKVSFGFRQANVAVKNRSLSISSQRSQPIRNGEQSSDSRPNLSFSTRSPLHSRVDSLHSLPPRANPDPHSAPGSASSAGPSWMRPLRLSVAISTPSSSRHSHFSLSSIQLDKISSTSARSSTSLVSNQSLVDTHQFSSSRTSLLSSYADQDIPSNDDYPSRYDEETDMQDMAMKESTVFYSQHDLAHESTRMPEVSSASIFTAGRIPAQLLYDLSNAQADTDEDATITRRKLPALLCSEGHIGENIATNQQESISTLLSPGNQSMSMESMRPNPELRSPLSRRKSIVLHTVPSTGSRGALDLDLLSPLSGSMRGFDFEELATTASRRDSIRGASTSSIGQTSALSNNRVSLLSTLSNVHAIATPKPTLLFAIASDDVAEVERVLASGEAQPNDDVGPQSALEFALRNDRLIHRTEIFKALLAYGADPSALPSELREPQLPALGAATADPIPDGQAKSSKRSSMNPAMKYYLNRANAPQSAHTSSIRRSFFRPLTRIRYDLVGQDRALEQLYWVLSMHSQQTMVNPLVVLCCGPSGHGKSFLARKFGSLLGIPTHTVNMTVLQSSHDLWQCPSMSPYDPPSEKTLSDFLVENQGKRCVVVLDEIDKNEDERNLWSLLAPWESGRCSFDSGRRYIDVRNVIWLGTSNTGQGVIFEYNESRKDPDKPFSREEYRQLMALLRPSVSEKLGASLLSRVTTVLPFVPFTSEEKLAIASEALISLGGDIAHALPPQEFEEVATRSMTDYVPSEGARSLYRNVSTHLMEAV